MEEEYEEIEKRVEALKEVVNDALEEIRELTNNNVRYDHRLERFIPLSGG